MAQLNSTNVAGNLAVTGQFTVAGNSTVNGLTSNNNIVIQDSLNSATISSSTISFNTTTTGGWARTETWLSKGVVKAQAGAFGEGDEFNYWYVGSSYQETNTWLRVNSSLIGPRVPIVRTNFPGRWVDACNGNALINSGVGAGSFGPMLSGRTTNGRIALAFWQKGLEAAYITEANCTAGNNTTAHSAVLLDESGNGTWSGAISVGTNLTVGGNATLGNATSDVHKVNGNLTHNGVVYFANGTTYNIDTTGNANLKTLQLDNKVKFQYNNTDKCVDVIFV